MSSDLYINASVTVKNGIVMRNGELYFKAGSEDPSSILAEIYEHLLPAYPKFYKMDQLSKLGWLATEILLGPEFRYKNYPADKVGIVLSNANASLDTDIRYYDTVKDIASPALFVYTLPNIVAGEISIRHRLKGENAFFIFDHFNAGFIQQYVSGLLNNDNLQACICGWVETLGKQLDAALFLVEKTPNAGAVGFTPAIMNQIYQ
ncbi:hypothetical protein [Pollutibacter soli]|uniref:hypothetical protein n=1 Tax=Pollutibacter soli TaxID=3034157 RepID=UPI003013E5C7